MGFCVGIFFVGFFLGGWRYFGGFPSYMQCKICELWPPENEVCNGNQVTLNYVTEKLICSVTGEKAIAGDRSLPLMGPWAHIVHRQISPYHRFPLPHNTGSSP